MYPKKITKLQNIGKFHQGGVTGGEYGRVTHIYASLKGASSQADGFYTPFNNILPDTEFLFGKDMYDYVSELASQWSKWKALEQDENRP